MKFKVVHGVDFSGAKLAGRNIWIARAVPVGRPNGRVGTNATHHGPSGLAARPRRVIAAVKSAPEPALELTELSRLEDLAGCADRGPCLAHLVALIRGSERALWGFDFPFALPVEVLAPGTRWAGQLALLGEWGEDAYGLGVECVNRAKRLGGPMHIRRLTDAEARAPFDCYHYRIIYQTFYGMRDVLGPAARVRGTAVLPFQYRRLGNARRVLVESCPSCTLKRLGLPHQNYKQPAGGPLTRKRRLTRHAILDGLAHHVRIPDRYRRTIMRNGGADALDAVIAAVGSYHGYHAADHRAIARHPRYAREGRMYV